MRISYFLICLLLVLTSACEPSKKDRPEPGTAAPTASTRGQQVLSAPLTPALFELPPAALSAWHSQKQKLPLVLLANDPLTYTLAAEKQAAVERLLNEGRRQELADRGKYHIPDPLLLPRQTMRSALQADILSELIWVVPTSVPLKDFALSSFKDQLLATGILTPAEAQTLTLQTGELRGQLAGKPFRAVHPEALPVLGGPVLLHIDLSFFSSSYENEVKTPLIPVVFKTLAAIKATGWTAPLVSLSLSSEEGVVPLEFRFLQRLLTEIFGDPAMLEQPLAPTWNLRNQARYLETFFQLDQILNNYQRIAELADDDPSVEFALYRTYRTGKRVETGLEHLEKAVGMDAGYAREYVNLAAHYLRKGNHEQAADMQRLARHHLPRNPLIALQLAETLHQLGKTAEASELLAELGKLSWSTEYYPEIPNLVKTLSRKIPAAEEN